MDQNNSLTDELTSIIDFDFGVGANNAVVRVSDIPSDVNVTNQEINLIVWLLLENETFKNSNLEKIDEHDGGNDGEKRIPSSNPTGRRRRRTVSEAGRIYKYADDLLKQCGIKLPFHELNTKSRHELFLQFTASSKLLQGRNFDSITTLFEALKGPSKYLENFEEKEHLGKGGYGHVYKTIEKKTQKEYAVKKISLNFRAIDLVKLALNEAHLLNFLKHPHIIQCYDTWLEMSPNIEEVNTCNDDCDDDDDENEDGPLKFFLLTEYCFLSLRNWIDAQPCKPEIDKIKLILSQAASTLSFLHSERVLHLDINPNNILWRDEELSEIKIIDFGLAIKADNFRGETGTYPYYPKDEKIFTHKSDVYSLGVTVFEISEKIQTTTELCELLRSPHIKNTISHPFLQNILPKMLSENQNARPTADEICKYLKNSTN